MMTGTVTNETRALAVLTMDPRNAKVHSETQIAEIAESIGQFGFVECLVVRPNGQLVGGEGRFRALQRLGRTEAECRVVAGLSEQQYAALALALNKIAENARWDEDVLRMVIGDMDEPDILRGLGFKGSELDRLLEPAEGLAVQEIETSAVADEFWISVRGPLVHQAEALQALQRVMAPFTGVEVDLGTIAIGA